MTRKEFEKINKLSVLLELAIEDFRATALKKNSKYSPRWFDWHTASAGYCYVCLAGAVMAKTLKAKQTEHKSPDEYKPPRVNRRLNALEAIRVGNWEKAAKLIGAPGAPEQYACFPEPKHNSFFTYERAEKFVEDLEKFFLPRIKKIEDGND